MRTFLLDQENNLYLISLSILNGLMSPAYNQYREDVGEYGAYGLSSLAKKTRTSYHLQMLYQRQHILLSYFKTLSVVVVWDLNPQLPTQT